MNTLNYTHLIDLELEVDFRNISKIGKTPKGIRQIASIVGGTFSGERLKGTVTSGHDWFTFQPDGNMAIDVRLEMRTDDDVNIYLQYQGRFVASPEVMAEFSKGKLLDPSEYSLSMTAHFECGDKKYSWLNNLITVGTGIQTRKGPIYSIYQIK